MHRIDTLLGLEPALVVVILTMVILLIPAGVLAVYALHRRKTEPAGD